MTYYDSILEILRSISSNEDHIYSRNNILPTFLYNEGWMLRLVLNWFSKNRGDAGYLISFDKDAKWFSEGRLETIFANEKGFKIGENYTVADGAYGNIVIGTQEAKTGGNDIDAKGISDIRLKRGCRQFVTIEAKMFSGFSKGVTNAPSYDQVARYVANMTYVVSKDVTNMDNIKDLAFYAFLPCKQKSKPNIKKYILKEHIKEEVKKRVDDYKKCKSYPEKEKWFNTLFEPLLKKIKIDLISWEDILEYIRGVDKESHEMLNEFYKLCKRFSKRDPVDIVDLSITGD